LKRTLSLLAVLLVLLSCNKRNFLDKALDKAGDNRKELEKVLNRYNQTPKDSLKYKAAVFLIENMCHHSYKSSLNQFAEAFDSIANHPYKSLSSEFIINNIELAFKAWYRIPKDKRASFDEFCNYILPYRSSDEPIETDSRQKLYTQYNWVYKYLDAGGTMHNVVDSITAQFKFRNCIKLSIYYKQPLSITQMEKSKYGLCDDGINYFG